MYCRMRIALNARFLLPHRMEGIGRFSAEITRRLIERRPADEFILLFDRPYDPLYTAAPNASGVALPPPARHPILWYFWFEWSLPIYFQRAQPDLFISFDGYCSLRAQVPTILTLHDIAYVHYPRQVPGLVRRYYQHYVPRYLKRADRVITVSNFVRRDIIEQYHIDPEKIHIACNGVRPVFQPLSDADRQNVRETFTGGRPYFLFLGAIHPRKNVDRLIRAYDRFREQSDSNVQLLIGGRLAWQTDAVRQAHRSARFRSDIHFLGYLPDSDVPRLLGAAEALVYVSLSEGFGVPILEAMHSEVPVITSNTSSLPEVAGNAALLVDPTCIDSIATAMVRLAGQPNLANRLIEAGRLQREHFTWERAADAFEVVINRVISG